MNLVRTVKHATTGWKPERVGLERPRLRNKSQTSQRAAPASPFPGQERPDRGPEHPGLAYRVASTTLPRRCPAIR
ncbi:hypothetical protein CLE01_05440 [Cryobacterium levicorallinum]|nr:hypothetical protein CLE01_05440 [Cryobacterium levicorallinum]